MNAEFGPTEGKERKKASDHCRGITPFSEREHIGRVDEKTEGVWKKVRLKDLNLRERLLWKRETLNNKKTEKR